METLTYSHNRKTQAWLAAIQDDLLGMCDREEDALREIERYRNEFYFEPDWNIAQYGNVLVYYYDVRERAKACGYSPASIDKMSDAKIWEWYKRSVRYVADKLLRKHKRKQK